MCLVNPMRVTSIQGLMARCEAKSVERDGSLFIMQEVGEHRLVHVGRAIQKIGKDEAKPTWDVFDEAVLAQEH